MKIFPFLATSFRTATTTTKTTLKGDDCDTKERPDDDDKAASTRRKSGRRRRRRRRKTYCANVNNNDQPVGSITKQRSSDWTPGNEYELFRTLHSSATAFDVSNDDNNVNNNNNNTTAPRRKRSSTKPRRWSSAARNGNNAGGGKSRNKNNRGKSIITSLRVSGKRQYGSLPLSPTAGWGGSRELFGQSNQSNQQEPSSPSPPPPPHPPTKPEKNSAPPIVSAVPGVITMPSEEKQQKPEAENSSFITIATTYSTESQSSVNKPASSPIVVGKTKQKQFGTTTTNNKSTAFWTKMPSTRRIDMSGTIVMDHSRDEDDEDDDDDVDDNNNLHGTTQNDNEYAHSMLRQMNVGTGYEVDKIAWVI